MIKTTEQSYREMPDFLRQAINQEIQRATEHELEEAKKRIDKMKSEIIAGVVLHVQKMIQMESLDQKLIITIKTD